MVKFFLFFILACGFFTNTLLATEDILTEKIKSFVDPKKYDQKYIDVLFSPKSHYYTKDRLDLVKIIATLKENGLLNLFYDKPQELNLRFKTSGSPLFFVKIMGDTLRNIGYYRYVTTESKLNASEFTWNIALTSEYATDPIILQKELKKMGCFIVDIQMVSATEWIYDIDMSSGHLNVTKLRASKSIKLKRSLYSYWLNVEQIKQLKIESPNRNRWYPYITYYDSSLHLLKVTKKDEKRKKITLAIPRSAKYIKISDLYTLKNIKDPLHLTPIGTR